MLDYTTKGQNMRFNDEEKRRMLEEVIEENTSIKDVAFKYGINRYYLKRLVICARRHGIESILHGGRKYTFSESFKVNVVRHVASGNTITATALEYNLSFALVARWVRRYSEKGIEGLSNARRSRPLKDDISGKEGKKQTENVHTEKEFRELQRQLRHAQMENEFLKKLDALVRERIERERRK